MPLSNVCRCVPVVVSQSRTVPSSEADAIVLPSGEKATARTQSLCPSSVCRCVPVVVSQSRTVPSCEADAIVLPVGREGDCVDPIAMPLERLSVRACRRVPEPHCPIV